MEKEDYEKVIALIDKYLDMLNRSHYIIPPGRTKKAVWNDIEELGRLRERVVVEKDEK